jgi:hypothetical protein
MADSTAFVIAALFAYLWQGISWASILLIVFAGVALAGEGAVAK